MTNNILIGDVLDKLKEIESETIQCCITSPPYFGLRDYSHDGQIGLEKTPGEYVAKMVEVFREVKRVLRKDGTLWLNLGDSYAGSGRGRDADGTWNPGKGGSKQETNVGAISGRAVNSKSLSKKTIEAGVIGNAWVKPHRGYKAKDLIGIPWRVAFALQADGWWLRQDIIWSKPNPMPESVTDRCTKSHEYIFLLTKSSKYYYDAEAIAEETLTKDESFRDRDATRLNNVPGRTRMAGLKTNNYQTRNKRSVWEISTKPYSGAHFATFPEKIPTICIKAGSKRGDIILDPFAGSGTTLEVAKRLGRNYIGIELNEKYVKELIEPRLHAVDPLFNQE